MSAGIRRALLRQAHAWGVALLLLVAAPRDALAGGGDTPLDRCVNGAPENWSIGGLIQGESLNGLAFGCMTAIGWGDGSHAGPAQEVAMQHLAPLARKVFIVAAIWQFVAVAGFGALGAGSLGQQGLAGVPMEMVRSAMKLLLVAFALEAYPAIIDGFRVAGSAGSDAMAQMIKEPVNGTTGLTRSSMQEQAEVVIARYLDMKDQDAAGTLPATARAAYDSLGRVVTDSTSCLASVAGRSVDAEGQRNLREMCRTVARLYPGYNRKWETVKSTFRGIAKGAADVLDIVMHPADSLVKLLARSLGFAFSLLSAAILAIASLAWLFFAAVGPLVLACAMATHLSAVGRFWWKTITAISLLPAAFGLVLGLYTVTIDRLIDTSTGASGVVVEALGAVALFAGLLVIGVVVIKMLDQLTGGVATMAAQVGMMAATAGASTAENAAAGYRAVHAKRGSVSDSLRGAVSGAVFGARAAMGGALRQTAGQMLNPQDPQGAQATAQTLGTAAAVAGMGATRLKHAVRGGASSLTAPTRGSVTAAEREWAGQRAGKDLASLGAQDFSVDARTGAIQLSGRGEATISQYRAQNRDAMRAYQGMSNQEFANTPYVRAALTGQNASRLDPALGAIDGSATRAIAERLPASVLARQTDATGQAESDATYRTRVIAIAQSIEQRAGGTWAGAQSQIDAVGDVASRSALGSDGSRYGVDAQDLSPSVPARQRRYVYHSASHMAASMALNAGRSPDAVYQHLEQQFRTNPRYQHWNNEDIATAILADPTAANQLTPA